MDITDYKVVEESRLMHRYELLQGLGDCYTQLGQYSQAQCCYEKAAVLEPDEPNPYVGLGIIALQRNLLDDAETAFRVARRLDSGCAKAYSGLAMVAHQRVDYEQAFQMYLKCLELDTDNLTALLGLFQTSCQMGSFSKVIHYLEVYLDMHPSDTSVMFTLASLYIKDSRFKEAQKMLLDVLSLDSENEDAANLLEEVEHNLAKAMKERAYSE